MADVIYDPQCGSGEKLEGTVYIHMWCADSRWKTVPTRADHEDTLP